MRRTCRILVVALFLVFLSVGSEAFGQAPAPIPVTTPEEDLKSVDITFNPLGVVVGGMKLTLAFALGSWVSLDLSPVYAAPLLIPAHVLGGELRFTFWPGGEPFDGGFVGPWAQASQTFPADSAISSAEGLYGATTVGGGVHGGYRWLWDNGFNLGLGGGLGYAAVVAHEEFPECPSGYACSYSTVGEGIAYFLLFDLGYAF
jgi:hypothetical protein